MIVLLLQEAASSVIRSPEVAGVEESVFNLILWLKFFIEVVGAVLIGIGAVLALARLAKVFRRPTIGGYELTRLTLARFLSLGLEFQLAADILATTVAPSWAQIGKLAAIAVIRTGLNYFLGREMEEEQEAIELAPAPAELKT